MFGYVVANMDRLSESQKERYRAVYCGLCRTLGEEHGQPARLTLTYDMTFLILLLSSLDRTEIAVTKPFRCPMHPLSKRVCFQNRHTRYAADINLLLAYYQRLDDWQDDRKASALLQSRALESKAKGIEQRLPHQSQAIKEGLAALSQLEKDNEMNPDLPAAVFGGILGEVFTPSGHALADQLRVFGDKLGRFIYLMDAAVDLKKDIKKERYNPLLFVPSSLHAEILQLLMADCTQAFDELPILKDRELMENILYSGVWTRYLAAQQGDKQA